MKTWLMRGLAGALLLAASAHPAVASEPAGLFTAAAGTTCSDGAGRSIDPWAVTWLATATTDAPVAAMTFTLDPAAAATAVAEDAQTTGRKRTVAVEYSDGYKKRAKIHKIASFATLPLFATEYWLGAYMYAYPDNITPTLQTAHKTVGISLGVLFGVNTVTGVWNLVEARKDPNHRGRRTFHGITMLLADAGFAIAGAMRPEKPIENVNDYYSQRQTHRAIAVTSMTIATISYLTMLFGSH